jgi:hypothetical protein
MVKRKERVQLPLLGEPIDFGNDVPRMHLQSTSPRVITPPPPSQSQGPIVDGLQENLQTNQLGVTTMVHLTPLVYINSTEESSSDQIHLFPSDDKRPHLATKRTRVARNWDPSSIELVDSEVDLRYATINEMLLFSHMVMKSSTTDSASICCRHCNGDAVFHCSSAASVSNHVPNIACHLLTCEASSLGLKQQIWNNRKHVNGCSVAYSVLLWNRMQEHSTYKILQTENGFC